MDGPRFFPVVPNARTRSPGHKLKHWKRHLNIRKHFFFPFFLLQTKPVTKHQKRLPIGAMDSSYLEIVKIQWDMVLGNWL